MKILVTGGAGFIGSAVVRLAVARGHQVVNLDALTYAACLDNVAPVTNSPLYAFERADIRDRAALDAILARHRPDTILHLAAESHVDRSIDGPGAFIATNITGTYTLLEAARGYWMAEGRPEGFRFHHVSTDEVFGSLPPDPGVRFTEKTPYDPRSPYSASKAASDHLVRAWHETYGLPVVLTNCSNNYGPYHFPEKLIPVIILNALAGRPLPVYGDGSNIRDWLYVEDHAEALLLVAEKGATGRSYAIGGGNERTNLDLVRSLCAILDAKRPKAAGSYADQITFVTDRPGHDARYAIDATRIREELGWRPSVTLDQGLALTVQWYLDNPAWWQALQDRQGVGQRLGQGQDQAGGQGTTGPAADTAVPDTRHLARAAAREMSSGSRHYAAYVGPAKQFDVMGAMQFRLLTALGLREHHRLLDLGCGALRAGRLLIPYLNAGCYFGIEPNAWLVEDGLAHEVGADMARRKAPVFRHVEDFSADGFGVDFDFVVAQSIFSHAGPEMVHQGLGAAARALAPGGLILATFIHPDTLPKAPREAPGWTYPGCTTFAPERVLALIGAAGLVGRALPWWHPRQTWYAMARAAADLPDPADDRHLTGAVLREASLAASRGTAP